MPLTNNPFFSFHAAGTLAKRITARRRRHQTILESSPHPTDPRTAEQLSWRTMYQACSALWHTLSPSEQAVWNQLATPRHMTGFALWQSQCLRPNPGIYLPLAGGTMQGAIEMDSHQITGMLDPTANQDAATKLYVDTHGGGGTPIPSIVNFRLLGRYHFPSWIASTGTKTLSANYIYLSPFYAPTDYTITAIGCQVVTASAGNARLGIYQDNGTIYPSTLISDCGTISTSTTGPKTITGLTIPFTAGTLYWLAILSDATPGIRAHDADAAWALLGNSTPDPNGSDTHYYLSYAYGALPSPFPAGATPASANQTGIGILLT